MELRKENRIVVMVDGRKIIEMWDAKIEESIQDNGKTLKLFIDKWKESQKC